MTTPTVYHNNAALRAEQGSGDGTIYATATGVSNSLADAQANKRFTFQGLAIITDLGADVDDKFNGFRLTNKITGTRYHIVDWVAGTDSATVFETPEAIDIVATGQQWEFRRTLYCPDADAAMPTHRAVNGFPAIKAEVRAANVALILDAYLPNLIGQGGFEDLPAGAFPTAEQVPGKWWSSTTVDWQVSATAPMRGVQGATWTPGGGGNEFIREKFVGALEKGKHYRLMYLAQGASGTSAADAIRIFIRDMGSAIDIDPDWYPTVYFPSPVLGAPATWVVSNDLVPEFTSDNISILIFGINANIGSAVMIRIDEFYLFEVVPVASLLAFAHNLDGSPGPAVIGYRCLPTRTGVTADDYSVLLAAAPVAGSGPLRAEFTAGIFPIYRIQIAANANFQYEVGELLLGVRFPWAWPPNKDLDPEEREYHEKRQRAVSGSLTRTLYSIIRRFKGIYPWVPAADAAILRGPFRERHVDAGEPFAIYWPGESGQPDIWPPTLVRHATDHWGLPHSQSPADPDYHFDWEEVL